MIKYPVRVHRIKAAMYDVVDADGNSLCVVSNVMMKIHLEDIGDTIANSLNAMNEFPFPHIDKFWNIVNWYYKYVTKE